MLVVMAQRKAHANKGTKAPAQLVGEAQPFNWTGLSSTLAALALLVLAVRALWH